MSNHIFSESSRSSDAGRHLWFSKYVHQCILEHIFNIFIGMVISQLFVNESMLNLIFQESSRSGDAGRHFSFCLKIRPLLHSRTIFTYFLEICSGTSISQKFVIESISNYKFLKSSRSDDAGRHFSFSKYIHQSILEHFFFGNSGTFLKFFGN